MVKEPYLQRLRTNTAFQKQSAFRVCNNCEHKLLDVECHLFLLTSEKQSILNFQTYGPELAVVDQTIEFSEINLKCQSP
ncbi:hypothetical protein CEAn_00043 [Coxiella endosymbiont of Amblyomma nuttalli]|nr:hypothetical protein CEAn_00043 [Coxiella endosymbiont of Amblyomma nuttalli]